MDKNVADLEKHERLREESLAVVWRSASEEMLRRAIHGCLSILQTSALTEAQHDKRGRDKAFVFTASQGLYKAQ